MPLVPHPPSVARPDPADEQGGLQPRVPSGGGRAPQGRLPSGGASDQLRSFAMAQKAGLPTLNFVKLKEDTKAQVDQALALGGANAGGAIGSGSQRGGNVSARARQYTAGGGGTTSGGGVSGAGSQAARQGWAFPQQPGSSQGSRPQPNAGAAPARREIVKRQASDGGAVGGSMVPYPPPERGNGSAGHAGGGSDIPDRVKQEPSHPLTARNQPTQESQGEKPAPAHRQPLTARPAASSDQAGGALQPQKYDEVSKPSATGGSNVPLTPAAALKLYMKQMTLYEQGEILDYPQIFYVGPNAQKHRPTAESADNHGFDDERGDYLWVIHDHIAFRYEILGVLGKGSFGVVTKCFDWKTNQLVALKIIRNKKRFHHQALVEVKLPPTTPPSY